MAGRITEAAEAAFAFNVERDYYKNRWVPYYRPLDRARSPRPPTGWMSWNTYFDKAGSKENLAEARLGAKYLKPFGLEFWSIESWQENSSELPVSKFYNMDLETHPEQFPEGMKWLAGEIRKLGFRPGLWTAPFGTGNTNFYKAHRDWFLHDKDGKPISCWNGKFTLDPTVAEAREHLRKIHDIASHDWGYEFFKIDGMDEYLEVYTTRCDTLFGATYMVIAPEHRLVKELTTPEQREAVEKYIDETKHKSDLERTDLAKDKTGVFSGSYAINPVNGKKIPIWIADYVLISYGTGAIMAVPAHDDRDWEFAKKFNLPIIEVLKSEVDVQKQAWTEDGIHVNSEWLDGLNKKDAIEKMLSWLEEHKCGKKAINYKLRDWVFSRQRYWGEPIPLIHCPSCGTVLVPEEELPLTLPEVEKYEPSGTGESPLVNVPSWVNCECPKCHGQAKRETNTMPQWAGSCWYYLRFIDPHNSERFVDPEKEKYWMPVGLYVGGTEHAVLHLLYSRFWHNVLYDLGLVSTKEPFQKLVNQGMITSFAYQKKNKSLVPVDKVKEIEPGKFIEEETGEEVTQVIAKMSKSLKNVINPDDFIKNYGADSVRMYEMFMGPLTESKPWATNGFMGVYRFLDRIWRIMTEKTLVDSEPSKELDKLTHKTIKKVTEDTESLNFNTAISQMMVLVNEINKLDSVPKKTMETLALLLSPYTPHLAEEMWEMLGHKPSISKESWPKYDASKCVDDEVEIVIQINGKLRSKIMMPINSDKEAVLETAKNDEKAKIWLDGKTVIKEIVVPNKLVNIVVK